MYPGEPTNAYIFGDASGVRFYFEKRVRFLNNRVGVIVFEKEKHDIMKCDTSLRKLCFHKQWTHHGKYHIKSQWLTKPKPLENVNAHCCSFGDGLVVYRKVGK